MCRECSVVLWRDGQFPRYNTNAECTAVSGRSPGQPIPLVAASWAVMRPDTSTLRPVEADLLLLCTEDPAVPRDGNCSFTRGPWSAGLDACASCRVPWTMLMSLRSQAPTVIHLKNQPPPHTRVYVRIKEKKREKNIDNSQLSCSLTVKQVTTLIYRRHVLACVSKYRGNLWDGFVGNML